MKTLLEVVNETMPQVGYLNDGCPCNERYKDVFARAGYKRPSRDSRYCNIHGAYCLMCWERPAEPLEDADHAR